MPTYGSAFMEPLLQSQALSQRQQLFPAELAQKYAAARYTTAEAKRLETQTAEEEKAAKLMAGLGGESGTVGGGPPSSISDRMLRMADIYARAGLVTKAQQAYEQASAAKSHEAVAAAAQMRQRLQAIQGRNLQLQKLVPLLNGVHDQASWDAANAGFEKEFGMPSPFEGTPFDAELVKGLKDSAMSDYQKGQLAIRREVAGATIADHLSSIKSRAARDSIAQEKLRLATEREKRLAKGAGKAVGSPSRTELDQADNLLPEELKGKARDEAIYSVAAKAKVLRSRNPALSADEALRQAVIEAEKNGSIQIREEGGHNLPFIGRVGAKPTAEFSPPIPLPASGKKSDLKVGQNYQGPDGVYTWTKEGWKKFQGGGNE